jgi:hypothetical protein
MRVLIVTFAFPPSNVIGAVRVGKFARYLDRRGHDVRALTTDIVDDRSLPLEIPRQQVIYTEYKQTRDWLGRVIRPWYRRAAAPTNDSSGDDASAQHSAPGRSLRQTLRRHYRALTCIPDSRADWVRAAIPAGMRLIEEWRPNIIYASAPPYTGLMVANRLARAHDIPWVAGLRDLWVDNPYYSGPSWRKRVDAMLERQILRSAARLVTVSPIWADQLYRRHRKVAEVVYNGYAAEDFPAVPPRLDRGEVLTIRYLGSIYPGFRDPSALFTAVALLPERLRNRVMVEFYSDCADVVLAAAAEHRITNAVAVRPLVPYRRALELQMQADVLLLLQWNDQRDEGNLPAKLFEYLYARRPILFLGYEQGIAARLVSERGAGLVSNNPPQIRDQLQIWLADKQAGRLKSLDPSVSRNLSRDEQYRKLEHLFCEILNEPLVEPN